MQIAIYVEDDLGGGVIVHAFATEEEANIAAAHDKKKDGSILPDCVAVINVPVSGGKVDPRWSELQLSRKVSD